MTDRGRATDWIWTSEGEERVNDPQDRRQVGADATGGDIGADVSLHLWSIRQAAAERAMYSEGLRAAGGVNNAELAGSLALRLTALPAVSALEALTASSKLTELIHRTQWLEVRACREEEASWADIGAALGVSGDEARAEYVQVIETCGNDSRPLHGGPRSRQAISDDRNLGER